uniref:Mitochondrial Rho GTPase 1 n=1 Tax=Anthurium amnicola TaxID=1678845 RepID=A0A1D1XH64_9ARAE
MYSSFFIHSFIFIKGCSFHCCTYILFFFVLKLFRFQMFLTRLKRAVIYPCNVLFDRYQSSLKESCASALSRVFEYFDRDKDGSLNNVELQRIQVHFIFEE